MHKRIVHFQHNISACPHSGHSGHKSFAALEASMDSKYLCKVLDDYLNTPLEFPFKLCHRCSTAAISLYNHYSRFSNSETQGTKI